MKIVLLPRFTALILLITFTSTNVLMAAPAVPTSSLAKVSNVSLNRIILPEELGSIQELHMVNTSQPLVIFIQDAHAVLDAQKKIQRIIEYFGKRYGIDSVALEGASGKLDFTLLRSFPDETLKKKVLRDYLERGELTGAEMTAIFGDEKMTYHGIEDWELYQENYLAYLRAIQVKDDLLAELDQSRKKLDQERLKVYPSKLNKFHEKITSFREDHLNLLELLRYLNTTEIVSRVKSGEAISYPNLTILLNSITEEDSSKEENLQKSVRRLAGEIKRHLAGKLSIQEEMEFHQNYQAYATGQMASGAYLRFLVEAARKSGFALRLNPLMLKAMGLEETLSMIKGTKVFEELETFLGEVEKSLTSNSKEEKIADDYRRLRLFKNIISLEATRDEIDQYHFDDSGEKLHYAAEFYRLAVKRDEALYQNLEELLARQKSGRIMVLAGGFHAAGFVKSLKEKKYNYMVVTPNIRSLAGAEVYPEIMKGRFSYRKEFEGNFYRAFHQHVFSELVSELSGPAFQNTLKLWRDEIIRLLSREGRIEQTSDYVPYGDRLWPFYFEKYGAGVSHVNFGKAKLLRMMHREIKEFAQEKMDHYLARMGKMPSTSAAAPLAASSIAQLAGLSFMRNADVRSEIHHLIRTGEMPSLRSEMRNAVSRRKFLKASAAGTAAFFTATKFGPTLSAQPAQPVSSPRTQQLNVDGIKVALNTYPEVDESVVDFSKIVFNVIRSIKMNLSERLNLNADERRLFSKQEITVNIKKYQEASEGFFRFEYGAEQFTINTVLHPKDRNDAAEHKILIYSELYSHLEWCIKREFEKNLRENLNALDESMAKNNAQIAKNEVQMAKDNVQIAESNTRLARIQRYLRWSNFVKNLTPFGVIAWLVFQLHGTVKTVLFLRPQKLTNATLSQQRVDQIVKMYGYGQLKEVWEAYLKQLKAWYGRFIPSRNIFMVSQLIFYELFKWGFAWTPILFIVGKIISHWQAPFSTGEAIVDGIIGGLAIAGMVGGIFPVAMLFMLFSTRAIAAKDLFALLQIPNFPKWFNRQKSSIRVLERLAEVGVNELWDNPRYVRRYEVKEGKVEEVVQKIDHLSVIQKALKDFLGEQNAEGKHVPGSQTSSLLRGAKTAKRIVKEFKDVIESSKKGTLKKDTALYFLSELLNHYVKLDAQNARKIIEDYIEALSKSRGIMRGQVRAEIWQRHPLIDLSHHLEFNCCTFLGGINELGGFGYLQNKSTSMLDLSTNEGRQIRAIIAAGIYRDPNTHERKGVLLVDSVEGTLSMDRPLIQQAIEEYARAAGFQTVFYNSFVQFNVVPKKFIEHIQATGASPRKLKIELASSYLPEYLEAFNRPPWWVRILPRRVRDFLSLFFGGMIVRPYGWVEGYAVDLNSKKERPSVKQEKRSKRSPRKRTAKAPVAEALTVRQIEPQDWPQIKDSIMKIEREVFPSRLRQDQDDLASSFEDPVSIALTVQDGAEAVGYVIGGPLEDYEGLVESFWGKPLDPDLWKQNTFYIESAAILGKYRGHAGMLLFKELIRQVRQNSKYEAISMHTDDLTIRDFFIRMGGVEYDREGKRVYVRLDFSAASRLRSAQARSETRLPIVRGELPGLPAGQPDFRVAAVQMNLSSPLWDRDIASGNSSRIDDALSRIEQVLQQLKNEPVNLVVFSESFITLVTDAKYSEIPESVFADIYERVRGLAKTYNRSIGLGITAYDVQDFLPPNTDKAVQRNEYVLVQPDGSQKVMTKIPELDDDRVEYFKTHNFDEIMQQRIITIDGKPILFVICSECLELVRLQASNLNPSPQLAIIPTFTREKLNQHHRWLAWNLLSIPSLTVNVSYSQGMTAVNGSSALDDQGQLIQQLNDQEGILIARFPIAARRPQLPDAHSPKRSETRSFNPFRESDLSRTRAAFDANSLIRKIEEKQYEFRLIGRTILGKIDNLIVRRQFLPEEEGRYFNFFDLGFESTEILMEKTQEIVTRIISSKEHLELLDAEAKDLQKTNLSHMAQEQLEQQLHLWDRLIQRKKQFFKKNFEDDQLIQSFKSTLDILELRVELERNNFSRVMEYFVTMPRELLTIEQRNRIRQFINAHTKRPILASSGGYVRRGKRLESFDGWYRSPANTISEFESTPGQTMPKPSVFSPLRHDHLSLQALAKKFGVPLFGHAISVDKNHLRTNYGVQELTLDILPNEAELDLWGRVKEEWDIAPVDTSKPLDRTSNPLRSDILDGWSSTDDAERNFYDGFAIPEILRGGIEHISIRQDELLEVSKVKQRGKTQRIGFAHLGFRVFRIKKEKIAVIENDFISNGLEELDTREKGTKGLQHDLSIYHRGSTVFLVWWFEQYAQQKGIRKIIWPTAADVKRRGGRFASNQNPWNDIEFLFEKFPAMMGYRKVHLKETSPDISYPALHETTVSAKLDRVEEAWVKNFRAVHRSELRKGLSLKQQLVSDLTYYFANLKNLTIDKLLNEMSQEEFVAKLRSELRTYIDQGIITPSDIEAFVGRMIGLIVLGQRAIPIYYSTFSGDLKYLEDFIKNYRGPKISLLTDYPGEDPRDQSVVLNALQKNSDAFGTIRILYHENQKVNRTFQSIRAVLKKAKDKRVRQTIEEIITGTESLDSRISSLWTDNLEIDVRKDFNIFSITAKINQLSHALLKKVHYDLALYALLKFESLDEAEQQRLLTNPGLLRNFYAQDPYLASVIGMDGGELGVLSEKIIEIYSLRQSAKAA
ncbi:MAG: twin-arginine translocation signal domain-containing protein [Candidatus Omnitrophica bacterium]|nr:twin-arginine translocation signal domain-containing protein [Candidatus Omnitrophota bacterium]